MADEWNITKPVDHTLISDLPGEHRSRKEDTKTVIEKEHRTLGDDNSGGEHKQGSAISYFLPTASSPTLRPDGSTALTVDDAGRLWWDTTTSELKVLVSISPITWVVIDAHLLASANIWANVQTFSEIPVFTKGIAANDTYVEGRNEAGDGNVDLIKAGKNEADDTEVAILPDGVRTATDALATEDTAVANVATVDAKIASVKFNDWETTVTKTSAVPTSETDEISSTLAATDLWVIANCYNTGTSSMRCNFKGYTDAANPPTTIRGRMSLWGDGQTIAGASGSFTMFVKKGDYYKITAIGQSSYVADVDRTYDRISVGN